MCTCLNSNTQPEKIEFFKASSIYFSKCLLKYSKYCPNSVKDLLKTISSIAMISNLPDDIVVNLCGVIFHSLYINKQKDFNVDFNTKIIDLLFEKKRYWCLYLLSREAMIYSHHSLSVAILKKIEDKVECETNAFYLKSLRLLSESENSLNTEDKFQKEISSSALEKCKNTLDETLMFLKASGVNNCGFQISWITLRKKLIETINNFIHHMANHNKPTSLNDTIFHHQAQLFIVLNDKFNDMINSFFDIDHNSARLLGLQALMCRVLAKSISTIMVEQHIPHPVFSKIIQSNTDSKLDPLYVQCEHILSQIEKYEQKKSINSYLVIHQILNALLRISTPIPQFFFTTTSNTALKLEIEINNNHNIFNRPISGILGQGLVAKFSGYITQHKHTKRKVKAIHLTIEKRLVTSDLNIFQPLQQENVQNFIVPVIEQSFQKKCICHFNTEGRYQLVIKTQMIDENDCYIWWSSNLANSDSTSYGNDERKHISILVDVKPYQPTANRSVMGSVL
ncbi:predicted protein [Naegleria gruberi]|uniref:Predicted protein n=1 Tax=Naegleria gruberi TaxID=5762 RepID=D2VXA8_NAEGR|nr:uncharacterized protein NAEGRDRAFT_81579 [Naegleria gruberi]EFC38596.1 predicted protein [Naegleria gruberi]|eukprot:XP_002671340.1 predicted protein [Naegleria gruberi strain NEG-M]